MIQRKQTLWFLLGAIVAGLAFVLPYGFKNTTSMMKYNINVENFKAQDDIWLLLLFSVIIVIDIGAIFLFKNRKMQSILAGLAIAFCVGAFALEFFYSTSGGNQLAFGIANSSLYIGLLLPILCVILNIMALNGVKKDIRLLKETDRLR
ncbi:MAG TPA: DUF4293 domain-containing protein [Chitinophagaceae bacterium]|nr:MAG: membrane protein [Bacteroidetes bacterium OLB11]HMN33531.1 DUF4293 domain-containing protein [Chitinophagaceae bacterium]